MRLHGKGYVASQAERRNCTTTWNLRTDLLEACPQPADWPKIKKSKLKSLAVVLKFLLFNCPNHRMDACGHEECSFIDEFGFASQYTGTRPALYKHERLLHYHACCQGDNRCPYGQGLRGKGGRPVKWNDTIPRFWEARTTEGTYKCQHELCRRSFKNSTKLHQHYRKAKHVCTQCSKCGTGAEAEEEQSADSSETEEDSADLTAVRKALDQFARFTTSDDGDSPSPKKQRVDDLSLSSNNKVVSEIQGETMRYESATSWRDRDREIQNERWVKLLEIVGNDNSNISVKDLASFLRRNLPFVNILMKADTSEEVLRLLHDNRAFTEELLRHPSFEALAGTLPVPSIDACLQLKDEIGITDAGWRKVVHTFNLPTSVRSFRLTEYRKQTASPHRTVGGVGCGYTYHMRNMIRHAIVTEEIPPDADIQVKLSLDAGTAVKGSRVQVELFQMDVISWTDHEKPTSALKSNKNSYLISLFLPPEGGRDPEYNSHMKVELAEATSFVNALISQPRLFVEGHGFHNITVLLCVDMKCLCVILGMNCERN